MQPNSLLRLFCYATALTDEIYITPLQEGNQTSAANARLHETRYPAPLSAHPSLFGIGFIYLIEIPSVFPSQRNESRTRRGEGEEEDTEERATDGAHSIIQFTVADDGV